jgi:hypothetical protein
MVSKGSEMFTGLKRFVAVFLVLCMGLVPAPPAHASSSEGVASRELTTALAEASETEPPESPIRTLFETYGRVWTVEAVDGTALPAAVPMLINTIDGGEGDTCWEKEGTVVARNQLGMPLFTYGQKVFWCATHEGELTRGLRVSRWAETHWPGWRFHDHIAENELLGKTSYGSMTQGRFSFGSGSVSVETQEPCNLVRVTASQSTVLTDCSL